MSTSRPLSITIACAIFISFSLIYLATLCHNLSITHDSITYVDHILSGTPDFHPNHLIYEPFLYGIVTLLRSLGLSTGLWTIEMLGALAGASALTMTFLILTRSMNVSYLIASMTVICAGFSFGIWYYSVAVEIYIYLLLFLLCSYYILLEKRNYFSWVVFAALLHSIAALFHQIAILFSLVPLLLLLGNPDQRWQKRLAFFGAYATTGIVIVGGTYFAVAFFLNKTASLTEFFTWLLGYGTKSQYWNTFEPNALILAAVGFGRALIGSHFVFEISALQENIKTVFSGKDLQDEIFLVRNLGEINAYALGFLSLVCLVFLGVAVVVSILAIRRFLRDGNGPYLWPLIAWLAPWVIFFTAWDSSNVDFWVVPVLLLWMLLALLLPAVLSHKTVVIIIAILGFGLSIVNGFGSIGPASIQENDFYRMKITTLTKPIEPESLIVIGDGLPDAVHLSYYTSHPLIILTDRFKRHQPVPELVKEMANRLQEGKIIYLWPDVTSIRTDTIAFYGNQYASYVLELLSHFCGPLEFETSLDKKLLQLSCLRQV